MKDDQSHTLKQPVILMSINIKPATTSIAFMLTIVILLESLPAVAAFTATASPSIDNTVWLDTGESEPPSHNSNLDRAVGLYKEEEANLVQLYSAASEHSRSDRTRTTLSLFSQIAPTLSPLLNTPWALCIIDKILDGALSLYDHGHQGTIAAGTDFALQQLFSRP